MKKFSPEQIAQGKWQRPLLAEATTYQEMEIAERCSKLAMKYGEDAPEVQAYIKAVNLAETRKL